MSREVTVDVLAAAHGTDALVLDVRETHEYVEGHVPGAVLVPLDALPERVGELPTDRPVYVVCRSGRRSLDAADLLLRHGVAAWSVAGGTLAWAGSGRPLSKGEVEDEALETVVRDGLTVTILATPDLGDRSYVVDDGTVALVVDPQRDLDRVHAVLAARGVRLGAVAETHLHNDYVSGGLELARTAGVPYLVPGEAEVAYDRTPVRDGDSHRVGAMAVGTVATPGHTPHHVAYAVGRGAEPLLVFTGGSLLFGAVGRTDLVSPELTEPLARAQHASVRRLADRLPGAVEVLPTHGFGSFCSASDTSGTASTLEQQRTHNPALTQDEERFVADLLAGLDAFPAYYAHMGPANAQGPAPVDLSPVRAADPDEVRARIEAGEWVVDLRDRTAFAAGHVPGTFSFDAAGNLVTYLGWLLPWGTPLTLLGSTPEQVAHAQRELVRIGIDRPVAQSTAPLHELTDAPAAYPVATFADLQAARRQGRVHVLDVRRRSEWEAGHLPGAQHVPLHELPQRLGEVPDGPVWVHCAGGYRASIAAALLDRAGKRVVAVDDDWASAVAAGVVDQVAA